MISVTVNIVAGYVHQIWANSGGHLAPVQYQELFPRSRLGCKGDHSPPSSAMIENVWSYIATPQYVFMVSCLIEHRDFFLFSTCVWYTKFGIGNSKYFIELVTI
jgi:hypothetical protein